MAAQIRHMLIFKLSGHNDGTGRKRDWFVPLIGIAVTVLTVLLAVVFFVAVFSGGLTARP
jgi:hypothetical protein